MIFLTLVINGSLTQHWITYESYLSPVYTYVEGGIPHTVSDICCVKLTGTNEYVATNHIFTGNFQ